MIKNVSYYLTFFIIFFFFIAYMSLHTTVFAQTDTEPPSGVYPTLYGTPTISQTFGLGSLVKDNVGVVDVEVFVDGLSAKENDFGITTSLSGAPSGTHLLLNWDVTKVTNGEHTLKIQIKDAAGNSAWVLTSDGLDSAAFWVSNPPTPPTSTDDSPIVSEQEVSKCVVDQEAVDTIISRIVERTSKRIEFIDQLLNEVEKFSVKNTTSVPGYEALVSSAYTAQHQADIALDSLEEKKILCNSDPLASLNEFKESLAETKTALSVYRDTVRELMKTVRESNNAQ